MNFVSATAALKHVAAPAAAVLVLAVGFKVRPSRARKPAHESPRRSLIAAKARRRPWPLARIRARTLRQRQIAVQLPDLIDLVVATVRAGFSPGQAMQQLIPVASDVFVPALTELTRRIGVGELFAEAVHELPHQLGPGALALADSLAIADRYGLPLAPILDRLADEARAQRRRNAEAAARRLPVRLSFPLVCCTLPSFALLSIVPLLAGTISSLRELSR